MTPDRWQRVQELFAATVDLEPARRRPVLEAACSGDEALIREVESLLDCDRRADGFAERSAGGREAHNGSNGGGAAMELSAGEELGPYRIVAPLAAGGMGEVYRAVDTRLGRTVALKLLPRELAQDHQALRRFQREARSASALNHPHICTLYDIGQRGGQPYLVMELLEGRSLKERLAEGRMPLSKVTALGAHVVAGLEAAHAKGVVHRDIKPANIFVTSTGDAKILDFGVAKVLSEPASGEFAPGDGPKTSTEATVSIPGTTPGTAAYMSPEQARGELVDARTDLFSVGVTLYEMATGTKPFRGEGIAGVLAAVLNRPPQRPRALNPAIPHELERIILKAIEKDKSARYPSASELRRDLERVAASGHGSTRRRTVLALLLVAAVGIAASTAFLWKPQAGETLARNSPEIRRLAVLPLRTAPAGPEQDLLAAGIGAALATDLARLTGVRLIAEASTGRYKETNKPISEIARELDVDAVLSGSAIASGERLVVRLNLTRAGADAPFWAEQFDGDFRTPGAVRTEVARAIAREVRLRLSPAEEARLLKQGTASREAFESWVRARHFLARRTAADIERAVAHFKQAINADPAYAAAYAGLADCHNQFATVAVGLAPLENRNLAIAAARRAIELDDENAEAHAALGFAKLYNWDWQGAELELTRAIALNPSYASARVWHASSLLVTRRTDEAIAEVNRAGELDPLSPITQTQVGWIHALAGRTDEAIARFRKVLAGDRDYPWALWQLGGSLTEIGQAGEAIPILKRACEVTQDNPAFLGSLGVAYARVGRQPEARAILGRLNRMARTRYVTPHARVYVCLELGDLDCYFDALEEGYRQRINFMAYLSVIPRENRHAAVRSDPRFVDLLRRLGYPASTAGG